MRLKSGLLGVGLLGVLLEGARYANADIAVSSDLELNSHVFTRHRGRVERNNSAELTPRITHLHASSVANASHGNLVLNSSLEAAGSALIRSKNSSISFRNAAEFKGRMPNLMTVNNIYFYGDATHNGSIDLDNSATFVSFAGTSVAYILEDSQASFEVTPTLKHASKMPLSCTGDAHAFAPDVRRGGRASWDGNTNSHFFPSVKASGTSFFIHDSGWYGDIVGTVPPIATIAYAAPITFEAKSAFADSGEDSAQLAVATKMGLGVLSNWGVNAERQRLSTLILPSAEPNLIADIAQSGVINSDTNKSPWFAPQDSYIGQWSIDGDVLTCKDTTKWGSNFAAVKTPVIFETNESYEISFDVTHNSGTLHLSIIDFSSPISAYTGANMLTNSTFDTDLTGWTYSEPDFEWAENGSVERVDGVTSSSIGQSVNIIEGEWYRVDYDVTHSSGYSQSNLQIDIGNGDAGYGHVWNNTHSATISQAISAVNLVDTFVYDTSKDSDGGAWRNRTQHTSWYNETLNTATRGSRKEFPSVAVIVITGNGEDWSSTNKVTIYDGDAPDMPMWMVFGTLYNVKDMLGRRGLKALTMLDGMLCIASNDAGNPGGYVPFIRMSFVADVVRHTNEFGTYTFDKGIGERETSPYLSTDQYDTARWIASEGFLVHRTSYDVDMTVLPNAPIDAETGLPVPTIAVATDGGTTVIQNDGTCEDITHGTYGSGYNYKVAFIDDTYLVGQGNKDHVRLGISTISPAQHLKYIYNTSTGGDFLINHKEVKDLTSIADSSFAVGGNGGMYGGINYLGGLHLIAPDYSDVSKSLAAKVTAGYNTGWMNGDIKLSTLSDICGTDYDVNLLTNSTFDADLTGWDDPSSDFAWRTGGTLDRVDGTVNTRVVQNVPIVEGEWYQVDYDVTRTDGYNITTVHVDRGDGDYITLSQVDSGHLTGYFQAWATKTMPFQLYGINDFRGYYDNVSIKKVSVVNFAELYTFPTQSGVINASTNNTPWYSLDAYNYGQWSIASGVLTFSPIDSSTWEAVRRPMRFLANQSYEVTFDVSCTSGSLFLYAVGTTEAGGSYVIGSSITSTGTYTRTIDNISVPFSHIQFGASTFDGTISNISVKQVVANHSPTNFVAGSVGASNLKPVGIIHKNPVATGAELVGYSGFSTSNYLQQDYTSELNFGTGDFSITGWFKGYDANSVLFSRLSASEEGKSGISADRTGRLMLLHNAEITFFIENTSHTPGYSLSDDEWAQLVILRRSGVVYIYANGELLYTAADTGSVGGTNPITRLGTGVEWDTAGYTDGSIALFRISATAPSTEQITKIYDDEKVLFEENAKATLYGTTDNVTALSYDGDTERLHVNTGSGQSIFEGLQRLDNPTTTFHAAVYFQAQETKSMLFHLYGINDFRGFFDNVTMKQVNFLGDGISSSGTYVRTVKDVSALNAIEFGTTNFDGAISNISARRVPLSTKLIPEATYVYKCNLLETSFNGLEVRPTHKKAVSSNLEGIASSRLEQTLKHGAKTYPAVSSSIEIQAVRKCIAKGSWEGVGKVSKEGVRIRYADMLLPIFDLTTYWGAILVPLPAPDNRTFKIVADERVFIVKGRKNSVLSVDGKKREAPEVVNIYYSRLPITTTSRISFGEFTLANTTRVIDVNGRYILNSNGDLLTVDDFSGSIDQINTRLGEL